MHALRFVILEHDPGPGDPRGLHWDFMLETGNELRTWWLGAPLEQGHAQEGMALASHRLAYLDYEGPVSGDRGNVSRWDQGTYRTLETAERRLVLQLQGGRTSGRLSIAQIGEDPQRWTFELSDA